MLFFKKKKSVDQSMGDCEIKPKGFLKGEIPSLISFFIQYYIGIFICKNNFLKAQNNTIRSSNISPALWLPLGKW